MIGQQGGSVTEFEGILPPRAAEPVQFDPDTPDGLIALALAPLQDEIESALADGDQAKATDLAYGALSGIAGALAQQRGDTCPTGRSLVHALEVELEPLLPDLQPDGTLAERGLRVHVRYQNWTVDQQGYAALERQLATCWPAERDET